MGSNPTAATISSQQRTVPVPPKDGSQVRILVGRPCSLGLTEGRQAYTLYGAGSNPVGSTMKSHERTCPNYPYCFCKECNTLSEEQRELVNEVLESKPRSGRGTL